MFLADILRAGSGDVGKWSFRDETLRHPFPPETPSRPKRLIRRRRSTGSAFQGLYGNRLTSRPNAAVADSPRIPAKPIGDSDLMAIALSTDAVRAERRWLGLKRNDFLN